MDSPPEDTYKKDPNTEGCESPAPLPPPIDRDDTGDSDTDTGDTDVGDSDTDDNDDGSWGDGDDSGGSSDVGADSRGSGDVETAVMMVTAKSKLDSHVLT